MQPAHESAGETSPRSEWHDNASVPITSFTRAEFNSIQEAFAGDTRPPQFDPELFTLFLRYLATRAKLDAITDAGLLNLDRMGPWRRFRSRRAVTSDKWTRPAAQGVVEMCWTVPLSELWHKCCDWAEAESGRSFLALFN